MKYHILKNVDVYVSTIALGSWGISDQAIWGSQDEQESLATIHAALDAGINFFDTAEAYGDGYAEEILGKALAGCRQQVVIATKVSKRNLSAQAVTQACEQSLYRLNTDYIDIYQPHWPNHAVPMSETFAALEKLRQEGKIRAIGLSNFGKRDLTEAIALVDVVSNQLPYSLLWRAIEFDVLPACRQHDMGVLCYSPLVQGLLSGKYTAVEQFPVARRRTRHFSSQHATARHGESGCEGEVFEAIRQMIAIARGQPLACLAIAWLLNQSGVTSVIAGARHPDQIANLAAASETQLDAGTIAMLSQASEPLKRALGPNPDMWQPGDTSRFR